MATSLERLTTVPVRDVWPHEAHDFTPWLLANVDVLSDLLGMDLALTVAEHPVGGFSLDLLGRDESTGRTVIVENQLETSDHIHLGQILTYAAGTDPSTIVWITTGFRAEHRAAIQWLNEHTDEDTRFFGVQIEVVRIGDSAPAPAFKLIVAPNDWEKQARAAATAQQGEITGRGLLYWDFWDQTRMKIQAQYPGWSRAQTSTSASWFNNTLGTSGAVASMSFARKGLCVQLYFDSPDAALNAGRFEALQAKRQQFDRALGVTATWDPMPGRKAARITVYSDYPDVTAREDWPDMVEWLIDTQRQMRTALDAVGGIPVT